MLPASLARRTFLAQSGVSLGAMALSSLLARSLSAAATSDGASRGVLRELHHPPKIKRVIWLYMSGQPYWAAALVVWGVVAMSLDNVLRPILIKRGADLPLLLIIAGVIGGLIAFGLVGLFVGPVILAVAYTLLLAWVRSDEPLPAAAPRVPEP